MTLVLLHPLPLDGSIWPPEMHSLATNVVSPRLYDFGESIEAWASGVLDVAGPGPLVLVGNSVGGSCAIEVALLAPDRVRLLVLAGAKAGHRPEPAFRDEALRVLSVEGMAAAWARYWAPLFAPGARSDIVECARRVAYEQGIDAILRGVRVFHRRPDRSELVKALDLPIVVVSGEYDRAPSNGAAFAAGLRHGTFHLIEGAGHYVPLERPAELTAIVRQALPHGL